MFSQYFCELWIVEVGYFYLNTEVYPILGEFELEKGILQHSSL